MAVKTKATLLTEAGVIRDEIIKNANTATRVVQHLYDFIESFDDTSIIVDSTVEYSTVEVITGSTHTITIAAFGHVSGNYKLARYQFDVDCDLTIENYDTAGSTLGTVNPIPAGTYNFWFYATAFGVGVVIQN